MEQLEKQVKDNDAIKENLSRQIEVVNQKRTELEKHQEEHIRRLEKIAGLTADEAKAQLVESLKQEAHTQALAMQQEIIDEAKLKRPIKKPARSSSRPYSALPPNRPSRIPSPYSTSKAMKSKARSSVAKDEISGPSKPLPGLT